MLTAELLRQGNQVTVIDNLLFGGESLLGFTKHTGFNFIKGDLCEPGTLRQALRTDWATPSRIVSPVSHCWISGLPGGRQTGGFPLQCGRSTTHI